MVIEDDKYCFVWVHELLSEYCQELQHLFLVGGGCFHKDGFFEAGTNGSKYSDSTTSELGVLPLDGVIRGSPSSGTPHPHVERRLVEVDQGLLLLDQPRQVQRECEDGGF